MSKLLIKDPQALAIAREMYEDHQAFSNLVNEAQQELHERCQAAMEEWEAKRQENRERLRLALSLPHAEGMELNIEHADLGIYIVTVPEGRAN